MRRSSATKSRECPSRKRAVVEQNRFGYKWRVEEAFSFIKRVFGEHMSAKRFVNMAKEMAMKAYLYNIFIASI